MAAPRPTPVYHYLHGLAVAGLADSQLLARFTAHRDEAAFAALVRRHGPMVLGVCRRVLHDWQGAEDAFQTTFLTLARKARSLARPDRLGPWLHGVAYRTAVRARAEATRRRAVERRAAAPLATNPADELVWRDLRPLLDEEVGRLPPRYREPFVLCYLEGLTNEQAARRLACSRGTIATRLARARERLRGRLSRRGLTLSGAALATLLASGVGAAQVPGPLTAATVKAGLLAAGQGLAPGAISVTITILMEGMKTMGANRLKCVLAVILAAGLGLGAGGLVHRTATGGRADGQGRKESQPKPSTRQAFSYPVENSPLPPPPAAAPPQPATAPPLAVPAPAVPAAPRKTATYRTANFVVEAPSPRLARVVGQAAERYRKELALQWLGKAMPVWSRPCPVRVKITSANDGSATSFIFNQGKILEQKMELEGSLDNILTNSLPHEITHTLFAHKFLRPIPRWADEGGALLAEEDGEERFEKSLRQILGKPRRVLPLRRLLGIWDYPQDLAAFYAQSFSIVRFLVDRGGRAKFLAFVGQGMEDGWDKAVRKQYGFRNVGELEKAWLRKVEAGRGDKQEKEPQSGAAGEDEERNTRPAPKKKPDEPSEDRPPPAARLRAVLDGWKKANRATAELHYHFTRTTKDPTSGKEERTTSGEIWARRPDLWRMDFQGGREGRIVVLSTGKTTHWYFPSKKTEYILKGSVKWDYLAGKIRGGPFGPEAIAWQDLFQGFFLSPVNELEKRFDPVLTREDKFWVYLEVRPRTPTDRKLFRRMEVVLDRKDYSIRRLWYEGSSGTEYYWNWQKAHAFAGQAITRPFHLKDLPKGWKRLELPLSVPSPRDQ